MKVYTVVVFSTLPSLYPQLLSVGLMCFTSLRKYFGEHKCYSSFNTNALQSFIL